MDGELSELDWISFYENTRKIGDIFMVVFLFDYWEGHSAENSKNTC